VFRSAGISAGSLSIATIALLIFAAGFPGVARADSKKFVAHARGNAFEAAATTAAESTNPEIAKMPVEEAGLVTEDNSQPYRAPALWSDSTSALIYSHAAGASETSDETPREYSASAHDNGPHQGAPDDSANPQFAMMFYGSEGFYFYPAAAGGASGTGFDPIDLGVGHAAPGDSNSGGVPGALHNGVARRIKWPFRVLGDDPVPVPEPSSLLLVGCGVLAVGLKRKSHPAK
jgi:hypothetical protein